jgi:hypothetical protein
VPTLLARYERSGPVREQQRRRLVFGATPGFEHAVKHQPNASSGGRTSYIEIGKFLRDGANGPEHQALLNLIGTLIPD